MIYVALLRGINVGGKSIISMAELKRTFESAGMRQVTTYINSGNIVFETTQRSKSKLTDLLEQAIRKDCGKDIRVLLKTRTELQTLANAIPADWVQGKELKCDVAFLWPDVDNPRVLDSIPGNADHEDVRYLPGAVIRKIAYAAYNKGRFQKIVGTPLYQSMTLRNTNTVRKLVELTERLA